MVLGAHLGLDSIPAEWLHALKKKERILTLLEKL